MRSVRWCDGGIGASREIDAMGWLGLAGHELGERESEQREKKREQRLGRGVGGGSGWLGVAGGSGQ